MKYLFLTSSIIIAVAVCTSMGDPVRIMPVGNSITAGEHYGFPSLEERTGYRKDLYEMLVNSGYNVDFVGSQEHGIRSGDDADWYDWNCEAYPGWKIPEISGRVDSALKKYKPDILLVHVGTNGRDWESKPDQVEDMLDMINNFSVENDHPVTVFLCLIINRFEGGDTLTSRFNEAVSERLKTRTGDQIKIVPVDMENGARLDYSDDPPDPDGDPPYEGGDMLGVTYPGVELDRYHPNDKGNRKMAEKFYAEIVKELGQPGSVSPMKRTFPGSSRTDNYSSEIKQGLSEKLTGYPNREISALR